jgi:hypothetical protein
LLQARFPLFIKLNLKRDSLLLHLNTAKNLLISPFSTWLYSLGRAGIMAAHSAVIQLPLKWISEESAAQKGKDESGDFSVFLRKQAG